MRTSASHRKCANGVTVIELLVVLTIAGILLTFGVPSFVNFIRDTRVQSVMFRLSGDLQLGRSEAIKRNARVLVCARSSATSNSCSTSGSASDWMNGWLVCYDGNADGVCDATTAADPNPIKVAPALTAPLTLTGPVASVIFFPVGSANGIANFALTGGTSTARSANVAASGNVTTAKTTY